MKARVKWVEDMKFVGAPPSGHGVVIDGSKEVEVTPMEMLFLGMGGCSLIDVVQILKEFRVDLIDCEVEIEAQRADDIPKVFNRIHAHDIASCRDLKPAQVERAINISVEKYCSASIMLGKTAEITHDYEIVETN